jgi:tetratricopeptide (TPR) repeat protein
VVARAPGTFYRFQKLVRRHKVAFAAAGAVIAALVIGLGVSSWSLLIQSQLRLQADAEKKNAQVEADRSRQIVRYLTGILADIAPSLAKGCTKKYVQEVLIRFDERVGTELQDQKDLEAVVRTTLGDVQCVMGQYASAETNFNKALAIRRKLYGSEHPEVAATLVKLVDLLHKAEKRSKAEGLAKEAVGILENLVQSSPNRDDYRLELGHSQWCLGSLLAETGRRDAGIEVMEKALALFEKAARDSVSRAIFLQEQAFTHRALGDWVQDLGRVDETERHYRAAIGLYAALKAEAPDNAFYYAEEAYSTWMLGTRLERAERPATAVGEYRAALALYAKATARFPSQVDFETRRESVRSSLVSLLNSEGK